MLDDLDAIDADFRHYYNWPPDWGLGIADEVFPPQMGAEQFFRLAELLRVQEGSAVLGKLRLEEQIKEQRQHGSGSHGPTPGQDPAPSEVQTVPSDVAPLHTGFAGDGQGFPPVFNVRKAKRG